MIFKNQTMIFEAVCELSMEPFEVSEDMGNVVVLSCIWENIDSAALHKQESEGEAGKST